MDQAWTNILDLPIQAAVLCNPVSDHLPIIMNLAIKKHDTKQPVRKRNFSEQNISKFNGCNYLLIDILKFLMIVFRLKTLSHLRRDLRTIGILLI